jgi:hypothetical protein
MFTGIAKPQVRRLLGANPWGTLAWTSWNFRPLQINQIVPRCARVFTSLLLVAARAAIFSLWRRGIQATGSAHILFRGSGWCGPWDIDEVEELGHVELNGVAFG